MALHTSPRRLCPTHQHLHSDRPHTVVPTPATCDVCRLSGFTAAADPLTVLTDHPTSGLPLAG